MLNYAFTAADRRTYQGKALLTRNYAKSFWLGQSITIVHDRDNPSTNALSVGYARNETKGGIFAILMVMAITALLAWFSWDDYRASCANMRGRIA